MYTELSDALMAKNPGLLIPRSLPKTRRCGKISIHIVALLLLAILRKAGATTTIKFWSSAWSWATPGCLVQYYGYRQYMGQATTSIACSPTSSAWMMGD